MYIIAGHTNSYGAGGDDVWLVKIESLNTLCYPDFTDAIDRKSWTSWFVLKNPTGKTANVYIVINGRLGDVLYSGGTTIPPKGSSAIRPRDLVRADCTGSADITSDQPIVGTCRITGNSNGMSMEYNAVVPFSAGATWKSLASFSFFVSMGQGSSGEGMA